MSNDSEKLKIDFNTIFKKMKGWKFLTPLSLRWQMSSFFNEGFPKKLEGSGSCSRLLDELFYNIYYAVSYLWILISSFI